MAVQPILQGDIPELRQTSLEVEKFDDTLHSLLDDLADTLAHHRALGLSAPQVGHPVRVIVADSGDGIFEFVNPEITSTTGEVEGFESCLSFPDHTLRMARPKTIAVEAYRRDGTAFRMECDGLLARIVCHEVDHLNGILFMDHLSDFDLISQMIGDAVEEDGDEKANDESLAKEQELQLISDTLSEFAWKLVLVLEMLEDYPEMQGLLEGDRRGKILGVSEILNALADDISQRVDSSS